MLYGSLIARNSSIAMGHRVPSDGVSEPENVVGLAVCARACAGRSGSPPPQTPHLRPPTRGNKGLISVPIGARGTRVPARSFPVRIKAA